MEPVSKNVGQRSQHSFDSILNVTSFQVWLAGYVTAGQRGIEGAWAVWEKNENSRTIKL